MVVRNMMWCLALAVVGGCTMPTFYNTQQSERNTARGTELLKAGEFDQAEEQLQAAVQADPRNVVAFTSLGDVYRKTGDYPQAEINYSTACHLAPYAFRPHYNLAITQQLLASVAATDPKMDDYLRLATGTYIRTLAIKPDSFESKLNLGVCYYQLGQLELAAHYFRQASELKPDDVRPLNNLAMLYEATGRTAQALIIYRRSIEVDTAQPDVLLALGQIFLGKKKYTSATAFFRAAARYAPDDPTPLQRVGVSLFRQKKYNAAITAFQQAMRIDPTSPASYRGYGVVCMVCYVKNPKRTEFRDRAKKAWAYSLELNPNQPDLQKFLDRLEE
jgi:Flp pilus assembly protein TadD